MGILYLMKPKTTMLTNRRRFESMRCLTTRGHGCHVDACSPVFNTPLPVGRQAASYPILRGRHMWRQPPSRMEQRRHQTTQLPATCKLFLAPFMMKKKQHTGNILL